MRSMWYRALAMFLPIIMLGCATISGRGETVVRLGPAPPLTCKPAPRFRWLDALDRPYSEAFRKKFSYSDANVLIRFWRRAPVFEGTLHARGLKPNFAYQMKVVGMPPFLWGVMGDAPSNVRIGSVGRWWRPGESGGNVNGVNDGEKDKMEGYLVFGCFVTDARGRADVYFRADRSYHVLWKTDQRQPTRDASLPPTHTMPVRQASYGSDRSYLVGELDIYAEHQSDRPSKGHAHLPPGDYCCFFLLTEESFHTKDEINGGDWAAALAKRISFTITPPEKPPARTASPGVAFPDVK